MSWTVIRAVATIWGMGGNCPPPPIGIAPPPPANFWEIITMTIFLWWFSRNFTNFKKVVVKFRGLRLRTPILFINNRLILYFKINKIQIKLYHRPSFWQISYPNWRPMGARGCRWLAKNRNQCLISEKNKFIILKILQILQIFFANFIFKLCIKSFKASLFHHEIYLNFIWSFCFFINMLKAFTEITKDFLIISINLLFL